MIVDEIILILQVLLAFAIAFVVLPMLVLPRPVWARSTLDALVINVLLWMAAVITVTHILAIIGLYNGVVVGVLILTTLWFARFRREFGGMIGLLQRLWPTGDQVPQRYREPRQKPSVKVRLITAGLSLPVVALLGGAYWLRVRHSIGNHTLAPPDAYIHMSWARAIGNNHLWPDGVYPQGVASFVAFVDLFAPFTHIHDVARFLGPLIATLLVFAIYYAVVRLTRNPGAAILAAGSFAFFSADPLWRIPWHRQVGILPQELGLVLAILALPIAVLAVTDRDGGAGLQLASKARIAVGGSALTVGAAGRGIAMNHPIPAFAFLLITTTAVGAAVLATRQGVRDAVGVLVAAYGSVAAGLAVVPIAERLGPGPYLGHDSLDRFAHLAAAGDEAAQGVVDNLLPFFGSITQIVHSWLSITAGVAGLIGLVAGIVLLRAPRWRPRGAELIALSAAGLVVIALWDVRLITQVIPAYYVTRIANVFAALLPLTLGAGLAALTPLLAHAKPMLAAAAALAIGFAGIGGLSLQFDWSEIERRGERTEIEYREMASMTRHLRRELDRGTYTIVGVTQQRQLIAGEGFFVDLWVFARDAEAVPHDEVLPVPTPDTFIFVEMDPYPVIELSAPGATEEYYFGQDKRGRIMATVYEWAEERRAADPETTLFHEGEHIRIYRVARNPAIRVDLENTDVFQDYTYNPGELFNEGPTSPREIEDEVAARIESGP